jgi:S1-C subfamily serine protease
MYPAGSTGCTRCGRPLSGTGPAAPPGPVAHPGVSPHAPLPVTRVVPPTAATPGPDGTPGPFSLPYSETVERLRPSEDPSSRRVRRIALVAALGLLALTAMVGLRPDGEAAETVAEPTAVSVVTDTVPPGADAAALATAAGPAVWQVVGDGCGVVRNGAAIAVDDHHLVTSFPLVAHDAAPTIRAQDGTERETELVHVGQSPDVAVLRVTEPLPAVLAPHDGIAATAAQRVAVLGWPGEPAAFAAVDAIVTGHRAGTTGARHALTFDRDFAPTDAGGAVLDAEGDLLAMVSLVGAPDSGVGIPATALTAAVDAALARADAAPLPADCGRGGFSPAPNDDWKSPAFGRADLAQGDDPALDALATRCLGGDWAVCDALASVAPVGSTAEAVALGCGGVSPGTEGACAARLGGADAQPERPGRLGQCAVLPRRDGGAAVVVPCAEPHDAQVFVTIRTTPVDPETGPSGEELATYEARCAEELQSFLQTATAWDFAWRDGYVPPGPTDPQPTLACFAWVAGRSDALAVG